MMKMQFGEIKEEAFELTMLIGQVQAWFLLEEMEQYHHGVLSLIGLPLPPH